MTEPLYADPVVAEIHKIRQRLLDDCGGDIVQFRRRLRERQTRAGREIIHGPVPERTEQRDEAERAPG